MTLRIRRAPRALRLLALACGAAILASGLLSAQSAPTTTTGAGQETGAGATLPIRRVVLYKSGVGYFEHLGSVRDDQTVTIDLTTGQLNDVLSSMTMLDLDGGRIVGVSYNSEAALERRLGALRLPLREHTTRSCLRESCLRESEREAWPAG